MKYEWGRGEFYTCLWCGDLEGKRPLGRPKRRWDKNNKMDVQKVSWVA
jgi:hypothetical protein